jgi:hypothetical protein
MTHSLKQSNGEGVLVASDISLDPKISKTGLIHHFKSLLFNLKSAKLHHSGISKFNGVFPHQYHLETPEASLSDLI